MRRRSIVLVVPILFLAAAALFFVLRAPMAENRSPSTKPVVSGAAGTATKPATTIKTTTHAAKLKTIASEPLPPDGTPLTKILDDLKARAEDGDAPAASRLFHDLGTCSTLREVKRTLPRQIPHALERDTKDMTPEQLKHQEAWLDLLEKENAFVDKNQALCEGVGDAQLVDFVPATLQAAQLGDHQAINCYIGRELMMTPGLLDHPEWLSQFKENAVPLAESAVQQGDWAAAGMLAQAYAGTFSSSLLAQATGTDPAKSYGYLRLERLGATGDFATRLDRRLADAAQGLSPAQIGDAEAWAQSTYTNAFGGAPSGGPAESWRTCDFMEH
ncbi:MAG TPA: hypothetical protein VF132_07885 [Rudaea sp.]